MANTSNDLDGFFSPRSIAIIGASEALNSFGTRYLQSLLTFGYKGRLYAVNYKGEQVLGFKIYPTVLDIPDSIDLAIICVSARFVPAILQDCLEKGVRSATVLSAGFSELGEEGRLLEEELLTIARRGIRIMGPNCFGVYCPNGKITIIPGDSFPRETGGVALIAQSGQFSENIVIRSIGEGIRFSKVISYGNACNINESDLLEYLAKDEETKVITAYIEGIKDGRRFFDIIRGNSGKKPIILWKVGLTRLGSAAAISHTGSLAGGRTVWDAFFRQSHAIKVENLEELIDTIVGFSCLPAGCGPRVALISGGGGGTVVGADACELAGLPMPPFPPEVEEKLRSILPAAGTSIKNPIDIGTPHPPLAILTSVLEAAASSDQIDVIMIRRIFLSIKVSKLLSGSAAPSEEEQQQLMEIPVEIKEKYGKPVVIVLTEELNSVDAMELEEGRRKLRDYYFANGIPVYLSEQRAFTALAHLAKFRTRIGMQHHADANDTRIAAPEKTAKTTLSRIRHSATTTILNEIQCKEILKEAGIDVIETTLAASKEEAVAISNKLGYPVAMKIISPHITHKTDAGGVTLGIKTSHQAGRAYDWIMATITKKNPGAAIEGISVQKMAAPGVEIVIGMTKDPQFGPMLMFGLGGIFVEIIQDVSFRIVPLTREDAREMIREIKGYRLLEGYRGQAPVDVSYLEKLLLNVSRFVEKNPEIKEMDINPIMAYSKGAVAVDARIILEADAIHKAK
jgi:acyl-CoA synthetase (NDP forming)